MRHGAGGEEMKTLFLTFNGGTENVADEQLSDVFSRAETKSRACQNTSSDRCKKHLGMWK